MKRRDLLCHSLTNVDNILPETNTTWDEIRTLKAAQNPVDLVSEAAQNPVDLVSELEKLKDKITRARQDGILDKKKATDVEYQTTQAVQKLFFVRLL